MLKHGILGIGLLLTLAQTASGGETLRIANSGDYPPYYFYDASGELVGFDVDISQALCAAMQLACDIVVVSWDGIIDGLVAGQYDAIIASMAKTPKREQIVSFTDYYSRSSASFLGRTDTGLTISPDGLRGKTLAAVQASYQQEYLEKNYQGIATIVGYDSAEECFAALVKGEVDLMLDDSFVLFHFLKTEAGVAFDFIGDPLPPDDPSNAAYIAVRKTDDALRQAFNAALQAIRLDGTLDKINRKYFPYNTY